MMMAPAKKRKLGLDDLQMQQQDCAEVQRAFQEQWIAEEWLAQQPLEALETYLKEIENKKVDKMALETVQLLPNFRALKVYTPRHFAYQSFATTSNSSGFPSIIKGWPFDYQRLALRLSKVGPSIIKGWPFDYQRKAFFLSKF